VKLFGYVFAVGRAKPDVARWIGPDELNRRIARGEPIAVIDVREPEEFTGPLGHIAASRNIPFSGFESRLDEVTTLAQTPIVLVCRTDKRSAKAAAILRGTGYSNVAVLQGGMEQWNGAGFSSEGAGSERVAP
jgi:rhodanese-related sulfurtransferase